MAASLASLGIKTLTETASEVVEITPAPLVEVLAPDAGLGFAPGCRVIAALKPFSTAHTEHVAPAGYSIAEILDWLELPAWCRQRANVALVFDDDVWIIPRDRFAQVRPKPSASLVIRVAPEGGGGGGSGGKNPMRMVLMIAVVVAAGAIAGPLAGALFPMMTGVMLSAVTAGITAGLTAVGTLLVNMLIPPPKPPGPPRVGDGSEQQIISGARNQGRAFQPVRRVFGRRRVAPDYAAKPYSEMVGEQQFWRFIFDFGYAPLDLEEHRIGTTSLDEFEDVEIIIHQNFDPATDALELYTDQVFEDPQQIELLRDDGGQIVATRPDCDEISFDIGYPAGLIHGVGNSSGSHSGLVRYIVDYRLLGDEGFTRAPIGDDDDGVIEQTAESRDPRRFGERFRVPARGQYELRIRRTTPAGDNNKTFNDSFLTAIRTITNESPINVAGRTLVEMRIRASDQMQGTVEEYTAIATSRLPVWDGAAFSEQATRHPAWHCVEILRGVAAKTPLASDRIDLAAFKAWADATPDLKIDMILESAGTTWEAFKEMAAAGRARATLRDFKYSVIRDIPQTVPAQHFTPRNSYDFAADRLLDELPDALRVRYVDETRDYEITELIVYGEGFTKATAQTFDLLDLSPSHTTEAQAAETGAYHFAVLKHRSTSYTLSTDLDHLTAQVGDLVMLGHDVVTAGLGMGRVVSVTIDGDDLTAITLDEPMTMESGEVYGLQVRLADGSSTILRITTAVGSHTTLTLETMIDADLAPDADDLATFGLRGFEAKPCIVSMIEPKPDFKAALKLRPAAPEVHDAAAHPNYDPPAVRARRAAAPGPVRNLTLGENQRARSSRAVADVIARWRAPESSATHPPAIAYDVFTLSPEGWRYELTTHALTAVVASDQITGAEIAVRVVSVGLTGAKSGPAAAPIARLTVEAAPIKPPAPQSLSVRDGLLDWRYPDRQPDLAGFQVRHQAGIGRVWDDAAPFSDDAILPGPPIDLRALGGGVRTILVRAITAAGAVSDPIWAVLDLGDPVTANVVETTDHRALGWTGEITDGVVDSGDLAASSTTDYWRADDDHLTWRGDDARQVWAPHFGALVYTVRFTPSEAARITVAAAASGDSWKLEYRNPLPSLAWNASDAASHWTGVDGAAHWSGRSGDFLPWPGALDAPAKEIEFRLTVAGGVERGRITAFAITLDVEDVQETLGQVAISAAGTRLALTKSYRSIHAVNLTLFADAGSSAITVRVEDQSAALGPLITCRNASDVAVDGVVNAIIQGARA